MEQKKVRKNPFVGTKIASAKAEFEARMKVLEPQLAAAIIGGNVKTVDAAIYSARLLNADTTIELMQSADSKKIGVTNINKRQLEANTYMLVTGLQMLQATAKTDAEVATAEYGVINAEVANGELELKQGDTIFFPRNSCEIFRTNDSSDRLQGFHALECPKILIPLTDIIPTIWVPKATQNVALKIVLHGVRTNKG